MSSENAIITCLPVVRTLQRATIEGVPFEAIAVNSLGRPMGRDEVKLEAKVAGKKFPMTEKDGIWGTILHNIPKGDHEVVISSEGEFKCITKSIVRITSGRFFAFDNDSRWVTKDGKIIGPLSGSFQGSFYFCNVGLPSEQLIQGQKEWDEWDRTKQPGEHMHYWEALTPAELDERFEYIANQGYDLLSLHSHWGLWERLDAGGRIAPHAAEQLALYLRIADRHGLAHIQALSSGPYGIPEKESGYGDTVPFSRYLEKGYLPEDWSNLGNQFDELFHQYIHDFASLFRDETALFGMTASGEGDFCNPERAMDTFLQIRKYDTNHLMLAEAIMSLNKLPEKICASYSQDMLGGRTYSISQAEIFPEFDLGIEFKFYKTVNNVFLAEGSWPPSPNYSKFAYKVRNNIHQRFNWTGTELYRIRLRDTLYLGLIHHLPIMNSWDEQMAEDEHIVLSKIRDKVNWEQPFSKPEIGVFVDDSCTHPKSAERKNLAKYEESFSRMPLSYRLHTTEEPPSGMLVSIDGRKPFSEPAFRSMGGIIPDEIKSRMPLVIADQYCASYTKSDDDRTLLAYFYNVVSHFQQNQALAGKHHRSPQPADFRVRVQNLPATDLHYQLYDLNKKEICYEFTGNSGMQWTLKNTDHDFFLIVTPA